MKRIPHPLYMPCQHKRCLFISGDLTVWCRDCGAYKVRKALGRRVTRIYWCVPDEERAAQCTNAAAPNTKISEVRDGD